MARLKDTNWSLPDGVPNKVGGTTHTWDSINGALLMDIRDELKELNAVLHCWRFQSIPNTLNRIDKRMSKNAPLRGKRKR